MDLKSRFQQMCNEFAEFRALIAETETSALDPLVSEILAHLGPQLDQNLAELKTAFPQALAEIQQDLDGARQSLTESQAQLTGFQQQLANAERAMAEGLPLAPEEADVLLDVEHGLTLRAELLDLVGGAHAPPTPAPQDLGDVYDLSTGAFRGPAAQPAQHTAKPPVAKPPARQSVKRPDKKTGDESVSGLESGDWKSQS